MTMARVSPPGTGELGSPRANRIFNAGTTTRANVGAFTAGLVMKAAVWAEWRNGERVPHLLDEAKKAA